MPSFRKMLRVLLPASAMTTSGFLSLFMSAMVVHAWVFRVELGRGRLMRVGNVKSPLPRKIVAVAGKPTAMLWPPTSRSSFPSPLKSAVAMVPGE